MLRSAADFGVDEVMSRRPSFAGPAASIVGLIDVEEPYRSEIEERATGRGAHVVGAFEELSRSASAERLALCVAGIRSRWTADQCGERVASLRKSLHGAPLVVLCQHPPREMVVRLMRLGVSEVVKLPGPTHAVAARCINHLEPRAPSPASEIIGSSRVMQSLRHQIAALAPLDSTVLLTGETGTGKGLIAQAVHRLSKRRHQPFVHVDCSGLSPTMIESELFGHERGAFTGAVSRRPGRFELAGEGTVFLDEVGDLKVSLQAKLLRVLQEREYERIGGTRTLRMKARVIAATNHDLESAVEQGRFRADLFFRLNVVRLHVPPLRDRIGDVPLLAREGLRRVAMRMGVPVPPIDDAFYAKLVSYSWPGNVRELMNVLERFVIAHAQGNPTQSLCEPSFDRLDSREGTFRWVDATPRGTTEEASLKGGTAAEKRAIAHVLVETGGNVARAARRLRMPRSTLRYWIKRYELGAFIPND